MLCHARTGSTLLAYLLNTNPDLYCPAETNLGQALLGVGRWAAEIGRDPEGPPGAELLGPSQICTIRDFVNALYAERLEVEGASRWCDKSLATHLAGELIDQLFPDAQYICLYRNFPDFAASAIEACPYGLRNYGFDSYASETPGNTIFSLARYWVDHVRGITAFQDSHAESAIGLTYESLVCDLHGTMARLGAFLEAPWDDRDLDADQIFRLRYSTGFQDHKITSTSEVRTDSVDRGWMLPIQMIPPPAIEAINELHQKLGYGAIDKPVEGDRRERQIEPGVLAELDQVMAMIVERMEVKEIRNESRSVVIRLDLVDLGLSFKIVPQSGIVSQPAPENWDARVTTRLDVLREVLTGANVASLTNSGRLRAELAEPDSPDVDVLATLHYFWRGMTGSERAHADWRGMAQNGVVQKGF